MRNFNTYLQCVVLRPSVVVYVCVYVGGLGSGVTYLQCSRFMKSWQPSPADNLYVQVSSILGGGSKSFLFIWIHLIQMENVQLLVRK